VKWHFFVLRHGLTNGEVVVIYKHPDEPSKVFGQYTFKDDLCKYETVFYYVENDKLEFTSKACNETSGKLNLKRLNYLSDPYIIDESHFNISNKLDFNINKEGYEIVYHVYPRGFGVFHNFKPEHVKNILSDPIIKKTPAVQLRGRPPIFSKLGKQNLKV
jgi:hypothetical protein